MALNYIQWWGSNSRALESVDYPFIAIILRFTLIWSGSIYWGQIDLFKSLHIGLECLPMAQEIWVQSQVIPKTQKSGTWCHLNLHLAL